MDRPVITKDLRLPSSQRVGGRVEMKVGTSGYVVPGVATLLPSSVRAAAARETRERGAAPRRPPVRLSMGNRKPSVPCILSLSNEQFPNGFSPQFCTYIGPLT